MRTRLKNSHFRNWKSRKSWFYAASILTALVGGAAVANEISADVISPQAQTNTTIWSDTIGVNTKDRLQTIAVTPAPADIAAAATATTAIMAVANTGATSAPSPASV